MWHYKATNGPTRLPEISPTKSPSTHSTDNSKDRVCSRRDVLVHYKGERRSHPAAGPSLTKKQEVACRRLKMITYPNPRLYWPFHLEIDNAGCKHCPKLATLARMLWERPSIQRHGFENSKGTFIITSKEQWETVPHSEKPEIQQWAIQRKTSPGAKASWLSSRMPQA